MPLLMFCSARITDLRVVYPSVPSLFVRPDGATAVILEGD
jgi:hypothetical protein